MPEGDSLHRVARRLQVLVGERLSAESPNPRGLATGVARAIDGRRLERVEAVGKNVLLTFEGGVVLRSHLRMNGRWRVRRVGSDPVWRGSPWLILRGGDWEATQWNGPVLALGTGRVRDLGPDLLAPETEPAALVTRLRRLDQGQLVGEVLVDQRVIAGIGNMWLAEALWHAEVSPFARIGHVSDEALERVLAWAREQMLASVSGSRPRRVVYRRAARGCPRCGAIIRSRGLGDANRTAYWCPTCQRQDDSAEREGFRTDREAICPPERSRGGCEGEPGGSPSHHVLADGGGGI